MYDVSVTYVIERTGAEIALLLVSSLVLH